jgi:hypothetical protein
VHDAQLHLGLGQYRLDGFGYSFEPLDTGNTAVLDAPVFQLRKDREPALGALTLAAPQPEEFLLAPQGDAQGQRDRLGLDGPPWRDLTYTASKYRIG